MTTKTNPTSFYSPMNTNNNDNQLFSNEQLQRYDANTIKNRYGDNWRSYASNVREIKQADGSIVREYIIEDPTLLKEIKPTLDITTSATGSDDEQQSLKNKFAQIKAKFEQKSSSNVMASPSSSATSSNTTTTTTTARQNSDKPMHDFIARNRHGSNDAPSNNRTNSSLPPANRTTSNASQAISNTQPSHSVSNSSFRRINSADEADEEVQQIHRQGENNRQYQETITPVSTLATTQESANIQYEILDEDGNPISLDGVQDLIKMSGVKAREVPQGDGTFVREYVIDDPELLSKFRPQQSQMDFHQQKTQANVPPPPPRLPLKQSTLFHQGASNVDHSRPANIEQIRVLEPQRRYEYVTKSGKRIEFTITNLGSDNQTVNDEDIRELSGAINARLVTQSSSSAVASTPQQPFTLPKPWRPAVDLVHRDSSVRQRTGSDNQTMPHNLNMGYQQVPPVPVDMNRSVSYGQLNQESLQQQFTPVFTEPIIDWSALRQQDPHGQIDPQIIQQFIAQKHQAGGFQTSAQFLPEQKPSSLQQQVTRSIHSPPTYNAPAYYQHQVPYSYQGQQQQSVRIINSNDPNFNVQQPPVMPYDHTRI